jgi:hypothetical protein
MVGHDLIHFVRPMLHSHDTNVVSRYVETTFWNLWGPFALFKRLTGKPIPGSKYRPEGYLIPEIGPKVVQGKGQKEHDEVFNKLMSRDRASCPFGFR